MKKNIAQFWWKGYLLNWTGDLALLIHIFLLQNINKRLKILLSILSIATFLMVSVSQRITFHSRKLYFWGVKIRFLYRKCFFLTCKVNLTIPAYKIKLKFFKRTSNFAISDYNLTFKLQFHVEFFWVTLTYLHHLEHRQYCNLFVQNLIRGGPRLVLINKRNISFFIIFIFFSKFLAMQFPEF